MKLSRFSEEQIIGIFKVHQAGMTAVDLCRKHGISDAPFYKWHSNYGSMEVSDDKRLNSLEDENAKLKRLLADAMLDVSTLEEMLEKKLLKPGSRRNAVNWAMEERCYSQPRASDLSGIDPRAYRYRSTRGDDNAVRARLRELAIERRRFGYRRLHILMRREGFGLNWSEARQTIQ